MKFIFPSHSLKLRYKNIYNLINEHCENSNIGRDDFSVFFRKSHTVFLGSSFPFVQFDV